MGERRDNVRRSSLESGRSFSWLVELTQPAPFRSFKTSPEVICLAVMLCVRYPLSLRNVEDLLHERGIKISHEIVRFLWNRFGPMFAAEIRHKRVNRMRSLPHLRWHLEKVFVKINRVTHHLWRAVDHEGEVLQALGITRRGRKAALKFLRETMKRHGHPRVFVTDQLRSCGAALKDPGLPEDREAGRRLNNRAENSLRGPSVHISRFGDGNVRCPAFAGCGQCRRSPPSTPRSTTISNRSALSRHEPSAS